MAKLTLTDLASLANEASAISTINANNALIEALVEGLFSLDGTSPNTVADDIDMDSNKILNLPDASSNQEPATYAQLVAAGSTTTSDTSTTNHTATGTSAVERTLKARLDEVVNVKDFGATGDGSTDDTDAIEAAMVRALAVEAPIYFPYGTYRVTNSIDFNAPVVITDNITITKDLDDSEVVRFRGEAGSGTGRFRTHIGYMSVGQASSPSAGQTAAHAYVFEDVIHAEFGHLDASHCAYAFVNDSTSPHGLCWGNHFSMLKARGCVQGYMDFPYPGSGAHTENFVSVAYFNGKEVSAATLLEKNDYPISLNNAEGFTFGTLNLEHTGVVSGGDFIYLGNETNLTINTLHLEGLDQDDAVSKGIFYVSNSGSTVTANINVGNTHINNCDQSAGTLSLVRCDANSDGVANFGSFSGNSSSNTWTDFRVLESSGNYCVNFAPQCGYELHWPVATATFLKGTPPSDFTPQLNLGLYPYDAGNSVADPGATLAAGKASFIRLTGTPAASLATITATAKVDGERHRLLTIENDTGNNYTITNTGNIKKPAGDSWDLTFGGGHRMVVSLNLEDNFAYIVGYTA